MKERRVWIGGILTTMKQDGLLILSQRPRLLSLLTTVATLIITNMGLGALPVWQVATASVGCHGVHMPVSGISTGSLIPCCRCSSITYGVYHTLFLDHCILSSLKRKHPWTTCITLKMYDHIQVATTCFTIGCLWMKPTGTWSIRSECIAVN